MLLPIFVLCISHLVLASPIQREYDVEDVEQLMYHFNEFKVKYNKNYSAGEEKLRFYNFVKNLERINELNRNHPLTTYGIDEFADLTAEEMRSYNGFNGASVGDDYGSCSVGNASEIKSVNLSAIDWREKGAVAPVQNQGRCASSWAFSSAAALEGAHALKHNTLLKVSEQQFLDCDTSAYGCAGGWPHSAISSSIQKGGQESEDDYPYIVEQQSCQFDASDVQVKPTACKVYPNIGDKGDKLASLLASVGPLSIALDCTPLIGYRRGIIEHCTGQRVDHAVTLVGYGEEGGTEYWIIKNSWGDRWGDKGYARVKKGVGCIFIGDYVLSAEVA